MGSTGHACANTRANAKTMILISFMQSWQRWWWVCLCIIPCEGHVSFYPLNPHWFQMGFVLHIHKSVTYIKIVKIISKYSLSNYKEGGTSLGSCFFTWLPYVWIALLVLLLTLKCTIFTIFINPHSTCVHVKFGSLTMAIEWEKWRKKEKIGQYIYYIIK